MGFALMGFLIFGTTDHEFAYFDYAIVTSISLMVGAIEYEEMYQADPVLAPIFLIIFEVLFFMMLLNMFIAIIDAHYEEMLEDEILDSRHVAKDPGIILKVAGIIKFKLEDLLKKRNKLKVQKLKPGEKNKMPKQIKQGK